MTLIEALLFNGIRYLLTLGLAVGGVFFGKFLYERKKSKKDVLK